MATGKSLNGAPIQQATNGVSWQRKVELVNKCRQDSLRWNHSVFQKLQSFYNAFRGIMPPGAQARFRNNLSLPFILAMIQSDVARKVQTSFGQWPPVSFEGFAPEDEASAKRNTVLISAQLGDCKTISLAHRFFTQADVNGTAIGRYGWRNVTRHSRYRRYETIAPGLTIPVLYEDEHAEIFNGPVWEPVDRLDFWQQPARVFIDDMDWVVHRYWRDLDDLLEDANGPYPYFDKGGVDALKMVPLAGSAQSEWAARKVAYRQEYDYMARQAAQIGKPVEIWEFHGLVPEEFAQGGGRHRCIAIGNGRVLLKDREGPMANGQKPFFSYSPMPDPYSFDGIGKAEVAFGPAMTAIRINNQKLDALDLLIDPMYKLSSGAGVNSQHLFSRAGRVILLDNGNADDLQPLTPDMRGVQAAYTEIAQLWQMQQLGTGETEALMGSGGGGRETARGFLGRQENALSRLGVEQTLADEEFIAPLANAFRQLDRQFLDLPHEVKILGSLATINPITGMPYQPERVSVDFDDLVPDYRARAVGASQMIGRNVRQQNMLQLLQLFSQVPEIRSTMLWGNWARQVSELFDVRNVNELFAQNQIPLLNQVADQSGQSPESVMQTATTPLEQLSPDILGRLLPQQSGGQAPLQAMGAT
jgi:hypothetical protein